MSNFPAFPFEYHNQTSRIQKSFFGDSHVAPGASEQYAGMTMRDYFAAKALQGYLSNAWQAETLDALGESAAQQIAIVAEISYAMADAMLEAREAK